MSSASTSLKPFLTTLLIILGIPVATGIGLLYAGYPMDGVRFAVTFAEIVGVIAVAVAYLWGGKKPRTDR